MDTAAIARAARLIGNAEALLVTAGAGLRLLDGQGREMAVAERGFDHFAA